MTNYLLFYLYYIMSTGGVVSERLAHLILHRDVAGSNRGLVLSNIFGRVDRPLPHELPLA